MAELPDMIEDLALILVVAGVVTLIFKIQETEAAPGFGLYCGRIPC